jgi:hypothetical protein
MKPGNFLLADAELIGKGVAMVDRDEEKIVGYSSLFSLVILPPKLNYSIRYFFLTRMFSSLRSQFNILISKIAILCTYSTEKTELP